MSREKQIEEMAKVIFENSPIPSVWHSDAVKFAQALYNAGYRRASDVAEEIFAELKTKAPFFCENQIAYDHFNEELAELKKKYTEDGNNEMSV